MMTCSAALFSHENSRFDERVKRITIRFGEWLEVVVWYGAERTRS